MLTWFHQLLLLPCSYNTNVLLYNSSVYWYTDADNITGCLKQIQKFENIDSNLNNNLQFLRKICMSGRLFLYLPFHSHPIFLCYQWQTSQVNVHIYLLAVYLTTLLVAQTIKPHSRYPGCSSVFEPRTSWI
jgi:hypothetical protein